jgi:hypothetical protein
MTKLLQQAFDRASSLPSDLQDQLARELIVKIESEMQWDNSFENSQEQLHKLGKKALDDLKAGRGQDTGFDKL